MEGKGREEARSEEACKNEGRGREGDQLTLTFSLLLV